MAVVLSANFLATKGVLPIPKSAEKKEGTRKYKPETQVSFGGLRTQVNHYTGGVFFRLGHLWDGRPCSVGGVGVGKSLCNGPWCKVRLQVPRLRWCGLSTLAAVRSLNPTLAAPCLHGWLKG